MHVTIRPERPGDASAIRAIHAAAFETEAEAALVDRLRANGNLLLSLVAEQAGRVLGHIAFSPVTIDRKRTTGVGLAPVAVLPDVQRRGVGRQLVRHGLAACGQNGYSFVVALGDPDYYRLLGFEIASGRGLTNEYGVDDPFRICLLQPDAPPPPGTVRYGPEFAEPDLAG